MVPIFDEFANQWKVKGGDPAARLTNRLLRGNYRLVVLPLVVLATGVIQPAQREPADPIHKGRMAQCLDYLERA